MSSLRRARYKPGVLVLSDNRKVKFRSNHYNTFGLMYGRPKDGGTCPGATRGPGGCLAPKKRKGTGKVLTCYVHNLANIYPAFAKVLEHNTRQLKKRTRAQMRRVLDRTIRAFKYRNRKHTDKLYFRLSTSGDFFSLAYARAWADVMRLHPEVTFWAYTRSLDMVSVLVSVPNLSLYLSTDPVNYVEASAVFERFKDGHPNLGLTFMGDRCALPADRKWITCPETSGQVKSTPDKGACAKCRLCFNWKENIRLRSIHFPVH